MTDIPEAHYDESQVPAYTLPDLLHNAAGEAVRSAEAWQSRRTEILELYRRFIFGRVPEMDVETSFEVQESGEALDGQAQRHQLRVTLTHRDRSHAFDVLIYAPIGADAAPAFVGLNFQGNHSVLSDPAIILPQAWMRENDNTDGHQASEKGRGVSASRWQVEEIIKAGYALVTCYYGDLDPDFDDGFKNGVHQLTDRSGADDDWASIAGWSWGLSRIADVLEALDYIDSDRLAVIGHSRLGKTSLWAGAQDERFKVIIANNSGCGGAAISRRCYGETIARINTSFPHWFAKAHLAYNNNEQALPVDQHMLIALQAPRPVYVASAEEDQWADPKGEFLSVYHASPVYALLGKQGLPNDQQPPIHEPLQTDVAYHIRAGKHDVTLYDWQQYIAFANRHLV